MAKAGRHRAEDEAKDGLGKAGFSGINAELILVAGHSAPPRDLSGPRPIVQVCHGTSSFEFLKQALLFPDLGILKIASQLKNGRGFIVLGGICCAKVRAVKIAWQPTYSEHCQGPGKLLSQGGLFLSAPRLPSDCM